MVCRQTEEAQKQIVKDIVSSSKTREWALISGLTEMHHLDLEFGAGVQLNKAI